MIARFMARLQRHPLPVLLAMAILIVLALLSARRIRVDTDLYRLLPPRLPGLAEFLDASRTFGALDAAYGLFEAPDAETGHAFVDAFAREAADSSRVAYVLTRFPREAALARGAPPEAVFFLDARGLARLRDRLDPNGFPEAMIRVRRALLSPAGARAAYWLQRDPLGIQAALAQGLAALPRPAALDPQGYWGRMVDGRYRLFVTVKPTRPPGDLDFSRALATDLRAAVARAREDLGPEGAGLRAGFTGGHLVAVEEAATLRSDIVDTLGLSLLLVLAVFWLFFRRLRVLLALGACLAAAVVLALGALGVYPGRLNPVTAGFSAVLCGLAVDYGIHLYNGLGHGGEGGLRELYRVVGRSVALGALTTAGAFLTLCVSDFPGMRQFGVTMVAGILASLLVMTTAFLPLAGARATRGPARPARLATLWDRLLWRRRGWVAVLGLVALAGLAGVGWPRLAFEANIRKLASSGETWRVQQDILELFGNRIEPVLFRWRGKDLAVGLEAMASLRKSAAKNHEVDHLETPLLFHPTPAGVEAARDALGALDGEALCAHLETAAADAGLVPSAFAPACRALRDLLAVARLPTSEALARSILPPELGPAWEGRFVRTAGGEVQLAAYVYPARRLTSPRKAEALARSLGASGPRWHLSGVGLLTDPLRKLLGADLRRVTLLACALVSLVTLAGLRSPVRAGLALLPVAAASVATLGLLGLLGIPLNPMNFVAVPLVLGLGIDDGLHLVTHAWAQPQKGVATLLAESGSAITCTTATTVAGFGSLLAASHPGLVSLGGLVCLGVTSSWLATVVLLPPLLHLFRGRRP